MQITTRIENSKFDLSQDALDAVAKILGDGNCIIYFDKVHDKYNRKQQGLYFAGIVRQASDFFGWSPEDMHEHLKTVCNKRELVNKNGEIVYIGGSTTNLNKKEYAEYIDRCIRYLAEQGFGANI
jgi:hypothetical protein